MQVHEYPPPRRSTPPQSAPREKPYREVSHIAGCTRRCAVLSRFGARPTGESDTLEQPAPSCHGGAVTGVAPTFEEIVSEYGALISRIAMSYESDITMREDLVQQIFLAIWQALPTFRGDSSVKTFVGKIAQNRSISHVAKRVREPRIAELPEDLATETPSPEDRKSVVSGKSVSVRVDLGGRRVIKKKTAKTTESR